MNQNICPHCGEPHPAGSAFLPENRPSDLSNSNLPALRRSRRKGLACLCCLWWEVEGWYLQVVSG
jgi:hypothetical protein